MQTSDLPLRRPWLRWVAAAIATLFLTSALTFPFSYGKGFMGVPPAPLTHPKGASVPAPPPEPLLLDVVGIKAALPVLSVFVAPGDPIPIDLPSGTPVVEVSAPDGTARRLAKSADVWVAPETPGLYTYTLKAEGHVPATLNVFVRTPFALGSGAIEGYRIGRYAETLYRNNPRYARPTGFVRVTPELVDTHVSPHFTLGQFLCKQASDYPKFLALDERLVLKLEWLVDAARDAGLDVTSFAVLSGYRTPYYNASIGNRTTSSRHLYGDAADIYVDENGDGQMDDLNGDGAITRADAEVLAGIVESQRSVPGYAPFIGGLGIYGPAPHRGPFIHVDVRGEAARW